MYQERISRVLAAMERMGLEQMLVSDPFHGGQYAADSLLIHDVTPLFFR